VPGEELVGLDQHPLGRAVDCLKSVSVSILGERPSATNALQCGSIHPPLGNALYNGALVDGVCNYHGYTIRLDGAQLPVVKGKAYPYEP
jgi:hypothetical protein